MREVLESQPNLMIKQAEVAELIVEDHPDPGLCGTGTLAGAPAKIARGIRLRDGRLVLEGGVEGAA